VANTAITTNQDLLELGHEARMNTPSTLGPPNWCWRLRAAALTEEIAERLLTMTAVYGRRPPTTSEDEEEKGTAVAAELE
jgi:4-alpha-glucanotransferase